MYNRLAKRNGSAMAMVIIFITLMVVLGTGVLLAAQHNANQSQAMYLADSSYYTAESAAQLAAQKFFDAIKTVKSYADPKIDVALMNPTEQRNWETIFLTAMKSTLSDKFNGIKTSVISSISSTLGTEMSITLNNLDLSNLEAEYSMKTETAGGITSTIQTVSLKSTDIPITVTAGGRSVTLYVSIDADLASVPKVIVGDASGSGAFYGGNNGSSGSATDGSIYQATDVDKNAMYLKYTTALTTLFNNTRIYTREQILDLFVYEDDGSLKVDETSGTPVLKTPTLEASLNNSTLPTSTAGYARITTGANGVTLNGSYPNIEYLEVTGKLVLGVNASCPRLKGVYVNGTIEMNADGSNRTFTGRPLQTPVPIDTPYGPNDDHYGTNFLIVNGQTFQGTANVGLGVYVKNATATINNSRFYANGCNIKFQAAGGSGVRINSNAIFTSTRLGTTGGNINIGGGSNFDSIMPFDNVVPQFFAETSISLYAHPNGTTHYTGVFATLGNADMFENSSKAILSGLFIGNCLTVRNDSSVSDLSDAQKGNIMDGGVFDIVNSGSASSIDWITSSTFKGERVLNLHESTGKH